MIPIILLVLTDCFIVKQQAIKFRRNTTPNVIDLHHYSLPSRLWSTKKSIGSEPQFSIPDDSTIETPKQRYIIYSHFAMFAYNLYLVLTSAQSNYISHPSPPS